VTVFYSTSNGTGLAGSDYTSISGTLTIPAGQTIGSINVPILGDTTNEADETLVMTLSNPTNATLSTTTSATGTITNDDAQANPLVAIDSVSTLEGNSGTKSLAFTVTLSSVSTSDVIVDYATSDGSAIAGSDYIATSGTLTIAAGSTSGTIFVQIIGDTTIEANQSFNLTLFNPRNGNFGTALGTGTITNDD
jgi:hypothetical protein